MEINMHVAKQTKIFKDGRGEELSTLRRRKDHLTMREISYRNGRILFKVGYDRRCRFLIILLDSADEDCDRRLASPDRLFDGSICFPCA